MFPIFAAQERCRESAPPQDGVDEMKIKYVLALALVAMLAIPGTASQFAGPVSAHSPLATAGLFSDPHADPALSVELPTRFTAVSVDDGALQHFKG